jgi:membrane peptidoglycan carboxypeptidase
MLEAAMKIRWPNEEARKNWEFVFKALQAVGIFVGVIWAAYVFWDTKYRELSKPYAEKKLAIYTDAARVLANLGVFPNAQCRHSNQILGAILG